MGFERQDDAERVMEVLPKRFAKYGLTIHPEKTRLISFYPPERQGRCVRMRGHYGFYGITGNARAISCYRYMVRPPYLPEIGVAPFTGFSEFGCVVRRLRRT